MLMHPIPDTDPAELTQPPLSRRSLLRGGTAVGLSALATAGLASVPAVALAAPATATGPQPRSDGHLVLDYRPSRPTGWSPTGQPEPGAPEPVGVTIGGHTPSLTFPYNGKTYQIKLLSFGQPGDSPDPVYENTPSDTTINFSKTLTGAFGRHYSFHYTGGFKGRHELRVQSYNVFVNEPTQNQPALSYGGYLYFVYTPDLRHGDPGIHDSLQFIQVVNWLLPSESQQPESYVDCAGRANPFYTIGGLTSIYGSQVFNFLDSPQHGIYAPGPGGGDDTLSPYPFMAEVFLVQDTGTRDGAGKDIVKVFGGIKYGWQVQPV
jgi:hypothetical protein